MLHISAPALAVPYYSYTYDFWGNAVPAPQAYVPINAYKGVQIGATSSSSFVDMYVHNDIIYIVDASNNAIILLDSSFQQKSVIKELNGMQGLEYLANPQGVFVTEDDEIYIADKDNGRIVVINHAGEVLQEIGQSTTQADLFTAGFKPQKVVVDPVGRIYVLAAGVYDGIMEFGSDGQFRGFIGAPRVAPSFMEYLWSRIATEEQRQRRALFLPVEHSNIALDKKGMIMATVSGGAINREEAIRRLNPVGIDLLLREGFFPPIGDLGQEDYSVFVDVLPREDGAYSVLNRASGRIFTYDMNGNLLYVFGGHGQLMGLFQNPVAVNEIDGQLLVLDSATNKLTVFEPTTYALLIHEAIAAYNTGRYQNSEQIWYQVLRLNSNYELAYSSVGKTLLMQNDYPQALEMFKLGNDRIGYSKAYQQLRHEFATENFSLVMNVFLGLLVLTMIIRKMSNRNANHNRCNNGNNSGYDSGEYLAANQLENTKKSRLTKIVQSLRYGLYVIYHPFDGFWDLKHEKRGNVEAATIILAAVTFTYIIMRQYTGFVFNTCDLAKLNILLEICSILIPFILWCVVNWALTTIMLGKGTFKDIYIASSYALIPIIIVNLPLTFISNFLIYEEGALYYLVLVLAVMWALMLMFIGTMVTHEYTMGKTVCTVIFILAGMLFCMFLGILFVSLLDRVYLFINDLYSEFALRI